MKKKIVATKQPLKLNINLTLFNSLAKATITRLNTDIAAENLDYWQTKLKKLPIIKQAQALITHKNTAYASEYNTSYTLATELLLHIGIRFCESSLLNHALTSENINIPIYKTDTIPDHPNNSPSDDTWKIKLNNRISCYCSSKDSNFKTI